MTDEDFLKHMQFMRGLETMIRLTKDDFARLVELAGGKHRQSDELEAVFGAPKKGISVGDLDRLEAAAAKATPGPWKEHTWKHDDPPERGVISGSEVVCNCWEADEYQEANAAFIALARNLVPDLLASYRAAIVKLTSLSNLYDKAQDQIEDLAKKLQTEQIARCAVLAENEAIHKAIEDYHFALDIRKNGDTAAYHLADMVQEICQKPWEQGAVRDARLNQEQRRKADG